MRARTLESEWLDHAWQIVHFRPEGFKFGDCSFWSDHVLLLAGTSPSGTGNLIQKQSTSAANKPKLLAMIDSTTEARSYLGIDVSKGYADFCLMGEGRTVWEETVLDDTDRGHEALQELLERALNRSEALEVGLEATGGYERNWLQTLREWGENRQVETDLVNALAVKRFAQQDLHGNMDFP